MTMWNIIFAIWLSALTLVVALEAHDNHKNFMWTASRIKQVAELIGQVARDTK